MRKYLKRFFLLFSRSSALKLSQKGQGTVEVILILVVSIAIVLALGVVYAKPMRGFINAYLGGYFQCLLQTGELPNLGADDSNSNSAGECKALLVAAMGDMGKGGTNGLGAVGVTSKNGGKNGNQGKNGSGDKNGSNGKDGASGEDDESGGSGGRGSGGSGGGSTRYLTKRIRRAGEAPVTGTSEGSNSQVRDLGRSKDGKFFKGGNNAQTIIYITKRTTKMGVAGNLISEQDKRKIKKSETTVRTVAGAEVEMKATKRKITMKDREKKETIEQAGASYSLSNIFRILLIIVIVGTLLLFVGGQAMQISKSWEK